MKHKNKPPSLPSQGSFARRRSLANVFKDRDGLGAYTNDPASYPSERVIYFDDDFAVINDLYPKSVVHTLLLPRSQNRRLHPFEAFEDPQFLAQIQAEALKLKALVAKELQRRYGQYSETDQLREAVLNGDVEWEDSELPKGREWKRDVRVGIHAHPSMNDLHVHVISRDMFSERMKHRKHYNSFNTPFFIDVAEFPLAADDPRRHPGHAGYLSSDLKVSNIRCHWESLS
jgi:aprataxin